MSEAVIQDPAEFDNFNSFFTRALVPGTRPIDDSDGAVVCPADGAISGLGRIDKDRILQAKGKHFTVTQLLTDRESHRFVGAASPPSISRPVIITGYICRSQASYCEQSMCRANCSPLIA